MSKTFKDIDFEDFDELDTNEYGIIKNPGKFEGEPGWLPQLWDRVQSGFSDVSVHDGSMVIDAFRLDSGLASLTGLDENPTNFVCLWSDDNGFVSHMVMTEEELYACEGMPVEDEGFLEYMENDDFGYCEFGGEGG